MPKRNLRDMLQREYLRGVADALLVCSLLLVVGLVIWFRSF